MEYVKPKVWHHDMVRVVLCHRLREEGVRFDVEYRAKLPKSNRHVRFDVVVIKRSRIVAIVEVKKKQGWKRPTIQEAKYNQFGVPVLCCRGIAQIKRTVEELKQVI